MVGSWVKACDLEGSTHEVYAAYAGSWGPYIWTDDDVECLLRWIAQEERGVLIVGILSIAKIPEDLLDRSYNTVNK